jgi:hypothetical protein
VVVPEIVGTDEFVGAALGMIAIDADEAAELPRAFVAMTVKVYEVPAINPVTVNGEDVPVAVRPLGFDVTVYPVIAVPPFAMGAVNGTVIDVALAIVGVPIVGASGTTFGVIDVEADDGVELPRALVATTVNVYAVPAVNPVTVIGEDVPDAVIPPGLEVTVYPVIAVPPFALGAVNGTETEVADAIVGIPIIGAPGTILGVIETEADEGVEVPALVVAVTVNV